MAPVEATKSCLTETTSLRRPCSNCPWRVDAPRRHWADEHFAEIYESCRRDGYAVMLCHHAVKLRLKLKGKADIPVSDEPVCQGWIRVLQYDAIGVRIASMRQRVTDAEIFDTEGPVLFESFEEMLAANRIALNTKTNKANQMSKIPPCNDDVFKRGQSLLAADTGLCRAQAFEDWVVWIRDESKQKVDWHYSGGIAHVLYIGDRELIKAAIKKIKCPARIMSWFGLDDPGLYRAGVSVAPKGAIAACYYEGEPSSSFMCSASEPQSSERKPEE